MIDCEICEAASVAFNDGTPIERATRVATFGHEHYEGDQVAFDVCAHHAEQARKGGATITHPKEDHRDDDTPDAGARTDA